MVVKTDLKKGQKITYTKEIMFKGEETVSAKIVAILGRKILLDNGDEILFYKV